MQGRRPKPGVNDPSPRSPGRATVAPAKHHTLRFPTSAGRLEDVADDPADLIPWEFAVPPGLGHYALSRRGPFRTATRHGKAARRRRKPHEDASATKGHLLTCSTDLLLWRSPPLFVSPQQGPIDVPEPERLELVTPRGARPGVPCKPACRPGTSPP